MKTRTIKEIEKDYDLELDKVISKIKNKRARLVLLQFPDGLKPYATVIVDYLKKALKGSVKFLIWMGSCFGACDIPFGLESIRPKIDLVIQFGHNEMIPNY